MRLFTEKTTKYLKSKKVAEKFIAYAKYKYMQYSRKLFLKKRLIARQLSKHDILFKLNHQLSGKASYLSLIPIKS